MKKFFVMALAIGMISFASCSSDDDAAPDCVALSTNIANTSQAYSDDPSDANCEAYAAAMKAYIDAKCEGFADLEASYDALACTP